MGAGDAHWDLFGKIGAAGMAPGTRSPIGRSKRKADCCALECPLASKHARIGEDSASSRKISSNLAPISPCDHHSLHNHIHRRGEACSASGGSREEEESEPDLASAAAASSILEEESYSGYGCEARRILPLAVSTIDGGEQDLEATAPWNVSTKGFFHVKGADLRAGYWVYYKGHCVAKALLWNDEFDEIRYEHQGFAPTMRGLEKGSVTAVSIGLMAVLDAIAWSRSLIPFAAWHIFADNVDALKLVDMYQRNLQFMKFHAERRLLDLIVEAAQSGRIHLHRR